MKIAVFLPNWIGDAAMATPALRALRRRHPAARIIGIMKPAIHDLLEGTPFLDECWFYKGQAATKKKFWALAWRMARARLDLVVLLTNNLRTAQLAWLSRAKRRIGYARYRRERLLTLALDPPSANGRLIPTPALDYYLELAYAAGCEPEPPRIELAVSRKDRLAADAVWNDLGLGERVVALNSSGAFGAAKLWPDDYCSALARRIAERLDHDVLVLCGPEERERAAGIASGAASRRVFSLAGHPVSLGLGKACVQRSRLLVSTDSGPRHFAAAFGVPVVSLFGPTHIGWSDTHYPKEVCLQVPVDCGPCQQRTCPEGHHRCMRELSVDRVFEAVEKQLRGSVPR